MATLSIALGLRRRMGLDLPLGIRAHVDRHGRLVVVDAALDNLLLGLVLLRTDKEVLALLASGNVKELGELEHATLAAEVSF